MQAKNLCFYLSDHGFGHIARNIPLIAEAVRRIDAYVYVVCGKRHLEFAKANLLELLTPEQFSRVRYRAEHTDIGLILQQGTLLVDTAALTDACAQYLAERPELLKQMKRITYPAVPEYHNAAAEIVSKLLTLTE